MMIYKANQLNQNMQMLGFVGAIVCEQGYLHDSKMIDLLGSAFNGDTPAIIKGQKFLVAAMEKSEFYGTVLFGLKAA